MHQKKLSSLHPTGTHKLLNCCAVAARPVTSRLCCIRAPTCCQASTEHDLTYHMHPACCQDISFATISLGIGLNCGTGYHRTTLHGTFLRCVRLFDGDHCILLFFLRSTDSQWFCRNLIFRNWFRWLGNRATRGCFQWLEARPPPD